MRHELAMSENNIFIMFHIHGNFDTDMNGIYFIQLTNNEDAIEKFKKINQNSRDIKFYDKQYTQEQVMSLLNFDHLWQMDSNDNVERLLLLGEINIPGENEIYPASQLEKWWEDNLDDVKVPTWNNIAEVG